jgi:hypothetical protein
MTVQVQVSDGGCSRCVTQQHSCHTRNPTTRAYLFLVQLLAPLRNVCRLVVEQVAELVAAAQEEVIAVHLLLLVLEVQVEVVFDVVVAAHGQVGRDVVPLVAKHALRLQ